MGKDSKRGAFKERAKHRVDDLQGMFSDYQSALKDSRSSDAAVLEEQLHQSLREWKVELNEPSPASSLQLQAESFSSDIARMLQLSEEQDDATSPLAPPKSERVAQRVDNSADLQEGFVATQLPQEQLNFDLLDQKNFHVMANGMQTNNFGVGTQLDYEQFEFYQNFDQQFFIPSYDGTGLCDEEEAFQHNIGFAHNLYPPPAAAFLGPKCALWDCTRLAKWFQTSQDYCSSDHAKLAAEEGCPGGAPILRPGICLKDSMLFAALSAKAQGKEVGVPECEGAATAKSPWNAPELFNLATPEGETITIREWLFFDKPRRAFESGNRKQRALPDYTGRGWHESRKQEVPEYKGLKRSYYMDPQPQKTYEWHLFEHEIEKYDACALYRLEYKVSDGKKSARGSVADLQKQMKNLNPTNSTKNGRKKANLKDPMGHNINSTTDRLQLPRELFEYGPSASCQYLGESGNGNGNGYFYP